MKIITIVIASLLTSLAYAQSENIRVIQTLCPKTGESELSINAGGLSGYMDYSLISVSISGSSYGLDYFYGLNESLALGISTSQSDTEYKLKNILSGTTAKIQTTGMKDVNLSLKGNLSIGSPVFYYKTDIIYTPEESNVNNDTGKMNVASGQNGISLTAGLVTPGSTVNWGGIFEYITKLDGTKKSTTSGLTTEFTQKGGGGTKVLVFIESKNSLHLNFSLSQSRSYSITSKAASGTTSSSSGNTINAFSASALFAVNNNFEIAPQYIYSTLDDKKQGSITYSDYVVTAFGATFRFLF